MDAKPAGKKVLIITYYWPPAGGIGVLRNLKLIKYFREFGWEPVVYAPSNAHYPYLDDGNFKDIPKNITIIKRPIREPFKAFKFLSGRKKSESLNNIVQVRTKKPGIMDRLGIWIRGNYFIPDARALWIKPSVRFLKNYLKEHPVDAIFTDGPPHTNTYIACKLSQTLNIPWIADFQDPWTQVDYYKDMKIGKRADRKHKAMEQEVFRTAKKISVASPTWKTELETIGANNVEVLYYGYDEDDFSKRTVNAERTGFTICHAGLLGIDRCPDLFLKMLGELVSINPLVELQLNLPGQVDFGVKEKIRLSGLDARTTYPGTVSRETALDMTMSANVLLLPLNQQSNAKGRIPGKLYEYLRTGLPIVAFGPEDSDVARILNETGRGKCFDYSSRDAAGYVAQLMDDGARTALVDTTKISHFSNRELTKRVASWLDALIVD